MGNDSGRMNFIFDMVIVLLSAMCCILVISMFVIHNKIVNDSYPEITVTMAYEEKDYGKAIKYAYFNENVLKNPSSGMKECEAVADFIEASYLLPVYEKAEDTEKISEMEKRIEDDKEAMGKLNLDWIRSR